MAGIYISNMEMPTIELGVIPVIIFADGSVENLFSHKKIGKAMPVPEHGRLGDLDELEAIHRKGADKGDSAWKFHVTAWAWVREMPTIIPADPIKEETE